MVDGQKNTKRENNTPKAIVVLKQKGTTEIITNFPGSN